MKKALVALVAAALLLSPAMSFAKKHHKGHKPKANVESTTQKK